MEEYTLRRSSVAKTSKVEADWLTEELIKPFDLDVSGPIEFFPWELDKSQLPTDWQMGLIVGASGTGKSTLLEDFGTQPHIEWKANCSIASHFSSAAEARDRFFAVGLNSVPTWRKPYTVLSTGEKFRADLARSIGNNAIVDEYTSVVSRAVAKSASVALRRWVSQSQIKSMVLASCHSDVLEWLSPDWVVDTDTGTLIINPQGNTKKVWWMAHVDPSSPVGAMTWKTCS